MYGLASLFPHSKLNSQKQASAHDAPLLSADDDVLQHMHAAFLFEKITHAERAKKSEASVFNSGKKQHHKLPCRKYYGWMMKQ